MSAENSDRHHDAWLWQRPLEIEISTSRATVETSLPCPDWCTLPTGHPFAGNPIGDEQVGALLRVHRRRIGPKPTHVALEAYERSVSADGPTDLDNLVIPCTHHHHVIHRPGWHATFANNQFTVCNDTGDLKRRYASQPRAQRVAAAGPFAHDDAIDIECASP